MRRIVCALLGVGIWSATVGCLDLSQARGQKLGPPIRDPGRHIQKRVQSWQSLKYKNIVAQQTDYSCGAAALATLVRYYWGDQVTEADFLEAILASLTPEQLKDRIENGLSMTDLRKAAVKKGYVASMGRRSLAEITELRVPVIVRIVKNEYKHFVVLRGLANNRIYLADPMRGNLRISFCEFSQQWPDRTILVVAKPGASLPEYAPLLVRQPAWVQPELQAARRALALDRLMPRNPRSVLNP
jgi:predicted double-glycine peptidase